MTIALAAARSMSGICHSWIPIWVVSRTSAPMLVRKLSRLLDRKFGLSLTINSLGIASGEVGGSIERGGAFSTDGVVGGSSRSPVTSATIEGYGNAGSGSGSEEGRLLVSSTSGVTSSTMGELAIAFSGSVSWDGMLGVSCGSRRLSLASKGSAIAVCDFSSESAIASGMGGGSPTASIGISPKSTDGVTVSGASSSMRRSFPVFSTVVDSPSASGIAGEDGAAPKSVLLSDNTGSRMGGTSGTASGKELGRELSSSNPNESLEFINTPAQKTRVELYF